MDCLDGLNGMICDEETENSADEVLSSVDTLTSADQSERVEQLQASTSSTIDVAAEQQLIEQVWQLIESNQESKEVRRHYETILREQKIRDAERRKERFKAKQRIKTSDMHSSPVTMVPSHQSQHNSFLSSRRSDYVLGVTQPASMACTDEINAVSMVVPQQHHFDADPTRVQQTSSPTPIVMHNNYVQSASPSPVMSSNEVLAAHLAQVDANRRKMTAMVQNMTTHMHDDYEVIAASGPMFLDDNVVAEQTTLSQRQKRPRLDIGALP